jgi:hypothetical protein
MLAFSVPFYHVTGSRAVGCSPSPINLNISGLMARLNTSEGLVGEERCIFIHCALAVGFERQS